jgi:hypothetical protein
MSAGKEAARDIRYGRRGGGWVPDGATPAQFDRPCELCGTPMVAGQRHRHIACCAAAGGLRSTSQPCNPHTFNADGVNVGGCAHCYLGAPT